MLFIGYQRKDYFSYIWKLQDSPKFHANMDRTKGLWSNYYYLENLGQMVNPGPRSTPNKDSNFFHITPTFVPPNLILETMVISIFHPTHKLVLKFHSFNLFLFYLQKLRGPKINFETYNCYKILL